MGFNFTRSTSSAFEVSCSTPNPLFQTTVSAAKETLNNLYTPEECHIVKKKLLNVHSAKLIEQVLRKNWWKRQTQDKPFISYSQLFFTRFRTLRSMNVYMSLEGQLPFQAPCSFHPLLSCSLFHTSPVLLPAHLIPFGPSVPGHAKKDPRLYLLYMVFNTCVQCLGVTETAPVGSS